MKFGEAFLNIFIIKTHLVLYEFRDLEGFLCYFVGKSISYWGLIFFLSLQNYREWIEFRKT